MISQERRKILRSRLFWTDGRSEFVLIQTMIRSEYQFDFFVVGIPCHQIASVRINILTLHLLLIPCLKLIVYRLSETE